MSDRTRDKAGQVIRGVTDDGKSVAVLVDDAGAQVVTGPDGGPVSVGAGAKPSTATASPSRFTDIAANAALNVKASAGNVFALTCLNFNAASRYLQLHNTATVPADQAVPDYVFLVPAGSQIGIGEDFFSVAGANLAAGIAFAFSTTPATYTAGTAGDQITIIHYK